MLAMGGLALGEAVTSSGLLLEITRHLQSLVGPASGPCCLPGLVLHLPLCVCKRAKRSLARLRVASGWRQALGRHGAHAFSAAQP